MESRRWSPLRAAPLSLLGFPTPFPYFARVTGSLRFIGLLNAAVWFGAAVFFTVSAGPVAFSQEMKDLLGSKNYPYYSAAISQILVGRYYYLQFACGLLALLHLLAEWLYFGKSPARIRFALLIGLVSLSLLGGAWLQPKLKHLTQQYTRPEAREAADRSFRTWHNASQMVNWLTVAGLAVYLWRVANPRETTRFVSATKFRS